MKIEGHLKAYLAYDPDTGVMTWIKRRAQRCPPGSVAGGANGSGYIQLQFNDSTYQVHRVAWLIMTGAWPEQEIDHINGIKNDNRWVNLRSVTKEGNARNRKRPNTNTSGVIGVSWHKPLNKWLGHIRAGGVYRHLGYFDDFNDACAARKAAEIQYGFHKNHGRS